MPPLTEHRQSDGMRSCAVGSVIPSSGSDSLKNAPMRGRFHRSLTPSIPSMRAADIRLGHPERAQRRGIGTPPGELEADTLAPRAGRGVGDPARLPARAMTIREGTPPTP